MTHTSTEQPEVEKLARIYEGGCDIDKRVAAELRRQHARVQELEAAQAQRAPLTIKRINELEAQSGLDHYELVRLVERDHGITQEKQG